MLKMIFSNRRIPHLPVLDNAKWSLYHKNSGFAPSRKSWRYTRYIIVNAPVHGRIRLENVKMLRGWFSQWGESDEIHIIDFEIHISIDFSLNFTSCNVIDDVLLENKIILAALFHFIKIFKISNAFFSKRQIGGFAPSRKSWRYVCVYD